MFRNFRREHLLFEGEPAGGGGGNPNNQDGAWFDSLPDDVKSDQAVAAFKGKPVLELVSGYRSHAKAVADATPPAKPEEYGIGLPASLADAAKDPGVKADLERSLAGMLGRYQKAGLSKPLAQALVEADAQAYLAEEAEAKKDRETADRELRTSWGKEYDQNVALVERAYGVLPEGLRKKIEGSGLRSDPLFIELIYQIGQAQAEGKLHKGAPGGGKRSIEERLYGSKAAGA